jgi:hypothetical protein
MSPSERIERVHYLHYLRETSQAKQSKTTKKKVQRKRDTKSLIQGMSLDELLKMQTALEEKG